MKEIDDGIENTVKARKQIKKSYKIVNKKTQEINESAENAIKGE